MNSSKITFNNASGYDRMMGVWSQSVGDVFLNWLNFNQGDRWLDIGCGTGALTEQIVNRCSPLEVVGVDPSEDQLEFARARITMVGSSFEVADAMDLPFESDRFDKAVMALVLFFIPDPKRGLDEMIRVTKKGGVVSAYVWDIPGSGFPGEPIHAELRSMKYNYPLPPSVNISSMNNLKALWHTRELKFIETKTINVCRSFENFEEFWEITSNSSAFKSLLSEMEREKFEELKCRVRQRIPARVDGGISYSSWANAIRGVVS
ncbi:class I SAM-dependent methyltransferase [Rhodospirillaceae bacterium]|nr:methyltransferase domain-containing protein [Rhodospirillaceae bacterium]MBT6307228.1 methyltransferase domain-containing protein [Rhodospirillaceae bacterium]MDC1441996.1 class I SAM-dependent methyltransferase [Rhodospirillaceae bacterium]|tara:strand:+ start:51 stop:836 length:786 start_codon:yes stop_codon:yes gene_type:complete